MAIGTITIGKKVGQKPSAAAPVVGFTMVGDDAYPAGGSIGVEDALKAKAGQGVTILGVADMTGDATHYLAWDATNGKLLAFVRATGLEVAPATSLAGTTFNLLAFCK